MSPTWTIYYIYILLFTKFHVKPNITYMAKVKRPRDPMVLLIEDMLVQWLHDDPKRVPAIRECHDKKVFELDGNGPQCVEAVSRMNIYIYIIICYIRPSLYQHQPAQKCLYCIIISHVYFDCVLITMFWKQYLDICSSCGVVCLGSVRFGSDI